MRKLIMPMAAALSMVAALPSSATITIPNVVRQAAAVYRFTIGDAQVTALSDGTMPKSARFRTKRRDFAGH